MPMPAYRVVCLTPNCAHKAEYKVAARWSDGVTSELKTYALSCPEHLRDWYAEALTRRGRCRLAPGETLEEVGIYQLLPGSRDQALQRLYDREIRFEVEVDSSTSSTPGRA